MKLPAKPVTIRGVTYPSVLAAARALGVSPAAICNARARGGLETVGLNPTITTPCPVAIRGVTYPSQNAAARALGVSAATIYMALERGTLDSVGLMKGILR